MQNIISYYLLFSNLNIIINDKYELDISQQYLFSFECEKILIYINMKYREICSVTSVVKKIGRVKDKFILGKEKLDTW